MYSRTTLPATATGSKPPFAQQGRLSVSVAVVVAAVGAGSGGGGGGVFGILVTVETQWVGKVEGQKDRFAVVLLWSVIVFLCSFQQCARTCLGHCRSA